MKGHGTKIGKTAEAAISALLTQRSVEEAARSVGISPSTLMRWLNDEDFGVAYRKARRNAFSQATARLQQASAAAATALLRIIVDPATPASARVRAAESVLDHAAKAIELEDIEARVSELERAAKSEKN